MGRKRPARRLRGDITRHDGFSFVWLFDSAHSSSRAETRTARRRTAHGGSVTRLPAHDVVNVISASLRRRRRRRRWWSSSILIFFSISVVFVVVVFVSSGATLGAFGPLSCAATDHLSLAIMYQLHTVPHPRSLQLLAAPLLCV